MHFYPHIGSVNWRWVGLETETHEALVKPELNVVSEVCNTFIGLAPSTCLFRTNEFGFPVFDRVAESNEVETKQ